jgi:hypothetical protein
VVTAGEGIAHRKSLNDKGNIATHRQVVAVLHALVAENLAGRPQVVEVLTDVNRQARQSSSSAACRGGAACT